MKTILRTAVGLFFALTFQLNALWVVNEPTITLYEGPGVDQEIEDVIRYGSIIEILDDRGEWVFAYIPSTDWHGWTLKKQLLNVNEDPSLKANCMAGFNGAFIYPHTTTIFNFILEVPYETPLKIIEEISDDNNRWVKIEMQDGKRGYVHRGHLIFDNPILTLEETVEFSKQFLGVKYIYGGTTSFGFDCSGFVQMLYRRMGVTIPCNARAQIHDIQFDSIEMSDALAGDLIFFRNSIGRIRHVGMMINSKEFIHSFPWDGSRVTIGNVDEARWHNGEYSNAIYLKRLRG